MNNTLTPNEYLRTIDYRDYILTPCQCPDCGHESSLLFHRTHAVNRVNGKVIIRCGKCVQMRGQANEYHINS
jgi:transcription elongation factor Elf1